MKVLVIGSGGREHALAWKCTQSPRVSEVIVAPGNAGTELEPGVRNVAIGAEDIDSLFDFARTEAIDLTIVGPEVPLVDGIVDRFRAAGLPCFGPDAAGAQLEGSKAFTKDFLQRYDIPTAQYQSFDELEPALAYIRQQGAPIVIKADGLAAGKGVIVAHSLEEAEAAATSMLSAGSFGDAGNRIVVEEFLEGEEASFIVITDGDNALSLASSQDHKARDDGDTGPNTGGMGAYSPAPVVTAEMEQRILDLVIDPTLAGLRNDGIQYTGFLYAGLMITPDGVPGLRGRQRWGAHECQDYGHGKGCTRPWRSIHRGQWRQDVQHTLVRGNGDGFGRVDDALDVGRCHLLVANRDNAVRIQTSHMAAGDACVHRVDVATSHELGFLDRALYRCHRGFNIDHYAFLQSA